MRTISLVVSLIVVMSLGVMSCCTTANQTPPPGSSNFAAATCADDEEMCLMSKQEGAGVRCLPISQCGQGTIDEGGKCVTSSQCSSDSLKCCTKGPMQAAEQLRCHSADQCSSGTIQ